MSAHVPSLPFSTSTLKGSGSPGGRLFGKPFSHSTSGPWAVYLEETSLQVNREMPAKLQSVLDGQPCCQSLLPGHRTLDLPAWITAGQVPAPLGARGRDSSAGAVS